MKKYVFFLLFGTSFFTLAQDYWSLNTDQAKVIEKESSQLHTLSLDQSKFNHILLDANFASKKEGGVTLFFPNEAQELEAFKLRPIPLFSKEQTQVYPKIKAFRGESTQREGVFLRITVSPMGVYGTMRTPDGFLYLQPKRKGSQTYVSYQRSDKLDPAIKLPFCKTPQPMMPKQKKRKAESRKTTAVGVLRTYRIAVAGTAEYTNFWGDDDDSNGTNQEDALAAVASTINRMNEVLLTDLGIQLELITDASLLYTNTLTDPFQGSFVKEIQNTLTTEVGEANYDLGHLFHRGAADGSAGSVGNVCRNGKKGSAFSAHPFTATNGSEGVFLTDYFDIDYVIHEVGHQLGALHTFSHGTEGFGVNSEPGSGSTIMSYAGIINGQNMQRHSDPYFHYHSIQNIQDYLNSKACQVSTTTSNQIPIVSAGENKAIPKGTAYSLTATASDADGDSLTYCWEQLDSGLVLASDFGPNQFNGSMNRSLLPTSSATRNIPNMNLVLKNRLTEINPSLGSPWETVSNVGRILTWGITVRDRNQNAPNGAGFTAQDKVVLEVVSDAGPFVLTTQSKSSTQWLSGANEVVQWEVANTNVSPINTSSVNLLLSVDGGKTFPHTLASAIPNNGEASIVVPGNIETNQARIKIEPVDNIYYAINSTDFSIKTRPFAMPFEEVEQEICGQSSTTFSFQFLQYDELSSPVQFSIKGLPEGVTATINPTTTASNNMTGTVEVTTDGETFGTHTLTLVGAAGNEVEEQPFFVRFPAKVVIPSLNSPSNNAIEQPTSLCLSWKPMNEVEEYNVQLSRTEDFSTVEQDLTTTTPYVDVKQLTKETTYYWRVKAINSCGESDFSSSFQFTTDILTCATYAANNVPLNIKDATPTTVGNSIATIVVADDLPITDINVRVNITHNYVEDLTLTLIAPGGEKIILAQNQGSKGDNFNNTVFDAEADTTIQLATPPFSGIFRPLEDLSVLYTTSGRGIWRLQVTDDFIKDTGTINSVHLDMCFNGQVRDNDDDDDLFPNEEDNCPFITNGNQTDTDNDGEGDLCDIDAQSNFSISKSDETCAVKNNGSIKVAAVAQYDYTVKITSSNKYNRTFSMTNGRLTVDNLTAADYLLCISSDDVPAFEQCFTATIKEPALLQVSSKVDVQGKNITLNFEGSDTYQIKLNGQAFTLNHVYQKVLPLQKGLNVIEVETPLNCQGKFEERVYLNEASQLYPNPAREEIHLLIGGKETKVQLSVFDVKGNQIYAGNHQIDPVKRHLSLEVGHYSPGSYIIHLQTLNLMETLKFIKQ